MRYDKQCRHLSATGITFETWEQPPRLFFSANVPQAVVHCPSLSCVGLLISLSWRRLERFCKFVTELPVFLQPLSFLFTQNEAVDVGEELVRGHRGDEAFPVHAELVQQHHAEVQPGDFEHLSAKKKKKYIYIYKISNHSADGTVLLVQVGDSVFATLERVL